MKASSSQLSSVALGIALLAFCAGSLPALAGGGIQGPETCTHACHDDQGNVIHSDESSCNGLDQEHLLCDTDDGAYCYTRFGDRFTQAYSTNDRHYGFMECPGLNHSVRIPRYDSQGNEYDASVRLSSPTSLTVRIENLEATINCLNQCTGEQILCGLFD